MTNTVIRCPKCGYPCRKDSEKDQQYSCKNCDTTFLFIKPAKKAETQPGNFANHFCSSCSNIIKTNETYVCSQCGKENLCKDCVDITPDRVICKECLKKNGRDCSVCGKEYIYKCAVCGERRCKKDYSNFNIEIKEYSRVLDMKTGRYYSLYCPTCKSEICEKCYKKKEGFLKGGLSFYCKKCHNKLELTAPHSML